LPGKSKPKQDLTTENENNAEEQNSASQNRIVAGVAEGPRQMLVKEKAATRARDALAAERRRLPMVRVEKDYIFSSPDGKVRLLDLFEGRRQLILYHFMFAPGVHGWPNAGCEGSSMFVDQIGHLAHLHALHARDTSFCLVSRAPLPKLQRYRKRMGWSIPWVSSAGSDFNKDFGVTTDAGDAVRTGIARCGSCHPNPENKS
jgi:predicted dithiol-disulfide oxidoreductase (DUF899 family)